MRKVIEKQMKIGQVPISKIEIDPRSRDEIPQLLFGLQMIHANKSLCTGVFDLLQDITPKNVDTENGRPGMDLWKILVLGTLRLNCNWDYDKVHNMANEHKTIRKFLGHALFDFDQTYGLQTIKDNVSLLKPEVLDKINELVVKFGHQLIGHHKSATLNGRCDSFVVETDVHFPTDINLLLDAIRKVLFLIGRECNQLGITDWRQYEYIYKKIKKRFNRANKIKRSTSKNPDKKAVIEQQIKDAHTAYVDLVESYVGRAKQSIGILNGMGIASIARALLIEKYLAHADRQIDQIRRRVIKGERISHDEKVFSIFEEHTEWISKGKAGVPQELGLRVCILEDQYGFILHHHVMEQQTDDKVAVQMVMDTRRKFACLDGCSFDKGFYSPENKASLSTFLERVILPKKGRLSVKEKEEQNTDEFIELKRKHAAVESGISALENHGLDRCRDHGIEGFKRYIALSVLARNIQKLGVLIQKKKLKQLKRKKAEINFQIAA
jgi:hypothetical protein